MLTYREITQEDIPALFAVRIATKENTYDMEGLAKIGITPTTVAAALDNHHRGWLCQDGERVIGFAMGDKNNGEMTVIALLPDYERRGIGATLLTLVEQWLRSQGWQQIWLTTDANPQLRAYGFYLHHGWVDDKIANNTRFMNKTMSGSTE